MMGRRAAWMALGAAGGVSGTIWVRRKAEAAAARLRTSGVLGSAFSVASEAATRAASRVSEAVAAGRMASLRREDELRAEIRVRLDGDAGPPAGAARYHRSA
jgi:hypothetical protein